MAALIEGIDRRQGIHIFGGIDRSRYSPYILTLFVPPVPGEVLVRAFSDAGIVLGSGSACSSNTKKRRRLFSDQGIPDSLADSALRVSIGDRTSERDIEEFLGLFDDIVLPLRKIAS